jgi:hypothetical protein
MAWFQKPKSTIYVVIRLDDGLTVGERAVTVQEAVYDEEMAAAEVQRLNLLNADRGVRYFHQATRLFPPGSSAGSPPAEGEQPPSGPAA